MTRLLIAGYGVIGQYVYREMCKLKPDIYDINIQRYSTLPTNQYDIAFVCVPTDNDVNGRCDVSIVEDIISRINANIYVIKSTVPVGTTDMLIKKYNKHIIFSPEHYGVTQHCEKESAFLILGGDKDSCGKVAQLYTMIKNGEFRIQFTDTKTAEFSKYMLNCFLALKVTFCNEFADIAKSSGILYEELRELFVMDERVGRSHTFVYEQQPFYNSHCFNKDVPALITMAKEMGIEAELMSSMDMLNKKKKQQHNI